MKYIIEGIDRLGKSTLVKNIQQAKGFHQSIHLSKPEKLKHIVETFGEADALKVFQANAYAQMFMMLSTPNLKLVYDRGHLGECVYAPLYRKYSGDYVFAMEQAADTSDTRLILLTTDNFTFLKDDGLSFDFNKKEEEQDLFIAAFGLSNIQDKRIINVHNGRGGYKTHEEVLAEALK